MIEDLPVVCKYCREPLRYIRTASGLRLIEKSSGDDHFIGDLCPVVRGIDQVERAIRAGTGR